MVYLYLVQHAEAKRKEEDPERHITERGKEETEKIAQFLASKIKGEIEKIIHSTKIRAKETAEIFAKYLEPPGGLHEEKDLEPLADPSIWADRIKALNESIMIVGHLPYLSKLASLLLVGSPEKEIISFRYSGVLCLERTDDVWGIKWYVTPDMI